MRTLFFVPLILVILLAGVSSFAVSGFAQQMVDECVSKPGSTAPQGSHWYYHDNANHQHCWYLGREGAKVRTPERRSESPMPPGPISRATAEISAKADPVEITSSENDAMADGATRWPDVPMSQASNRHVEDRAEADSQDDMPVTSPAPTPADLAVSGSPSLPAAGVEYVLALLAGAFAGAGMIVSWIFRSFAGHLGRSDLLDQFSAPSSRRPPHRPRSAGRDSVARRADVFHKSAASAGQGAAVRQPPTPTEETKEGQSEPADIERTLRQLLQAWQRIPACPTGVVPGNEGLACRELGDKRTRYVHGV